MLSINVTAAAVPGLLNKREWGDAGTQRSRKDEVSLVWFGMPETSIPPDGRLPHAISIDDRRYIEIAALLTTHSEILSPLSGYVRLLTHSEVRTLNARIDVGSRRLTDARVCVGAAIAEAILQRGIVDRSTDVPLSACLKTLSWTLGTYYLQEGDHPFESIAARWSTVWSTLREDDARVPVTDVLEIWAPLLSSSTKALSLAIGREETSAIVDMIGETRANISKLWKHLASISPVARENPLTSDQSREERYQNLMKAQGQLSSSHSLSSEFGRALLGLYAAACVDFSVSAVTLLPASAPPVSRLWAGLFAGAAMKAGAPRELTALEARVDTMFESASQISPRTGADLGFEEMMMMARARALRVSELRLRSPNELAVEIVPGLVSTFSVGTKRPSKRREPSPREQDVNAMLNQIERSVEAIRRGLTLDG